MEYRCQMEIGNVCVQEVSWRHDSVEEEVNATHSQPEDELYIQLEKSRLSITLPRWIHIFNSPSYSHGKGNTWCIRKESILRQNYLDNYLTTPSSWLAPKAAQNYFATPDTISKLTPSLSYWFTSQSIRVTFNQYSPVTFKKSKSPNVGLEPTTPRLRVSCSTDWASRATNAGWHTLGPRFWTFIEGLRGPFIHWNANEIFHW